MNLISVRLITADVEKLMNFYGYITGHNPVLYTPDFAEVQTKTATLAIGSTKTLQAFGGENIANAAKNKTAIKNRQPCPGETVVYYSGIQMVIW